MLDRILISKPKSKKGSIWIVLLVFLDLFIVSASLYIFITSSWVAREKIYDASIIDKLSEKENLAEFYIREAGKKAVVESYKDIANNQEYIGGAVTLINNIDPEFGLLNENLNENFRASFIENFKKEFSAYEFDEQYLKDLRDVVLSEDFQVYFDGEIINVVFLNLQFKGSVEDINVNYNPSISIAISLTKIGLESFNDIYQTKEECKSKENMQECFNSNLRNFYSEFQSKEKPNSEGYSLATLISKKEFFLDSDKSYEKIQFSFVPN